MHDRKAMKMEKLNYETIQRYQSFVDVEEMDKAVRGFLYDINRPFQKVH
ncbi:hypothetical protein [Bacillus sp. S/N-304-OC-R1]|nr:hypothetical protein [Bacillus sp. S/N-304-OC-R1]MBY0121473.1 hypothetical protein [Bacillus sp. S/N-304-OC-R1]